MPRYPASRTRGLKSYPKLPEGMTTKAMRVSGPVEVVNWAAGLTALQRGELFAAARLASLQSVGGEGEHVAREINTLVTCVDSEVKKKRGRPKKVVDEGGAGEVGTPKPRVSKAKASKGQVTVGGAVVESQPSTAKRGRPKKVSE